ncbi:MULTISPECIES: GIY-YIG nuclease family protein [unclassified Desulfovibrio]|uniref:GIY-YIG nuclease family protein n=1 Tax=unclassified Desulfovibrio TaxID=2593640 RepID=UPI002FD9072E
MKLRSAPRSMATSLDAIFDEEDDLGLLAGVVPTKKKNAATTDSSVSAFLELVAFFEVHKREPDENKPEEKPLAWRLKGYRTRPELRVKVLEYDNVGLLSEKAAAPVPCKSLPDAPVAVREVTSLEDIFDDDDDLGLLGGIDTSIFTATPARPLTDKDMPDEIASRKACEDFYLYEKLFQDVQGVLNTKAVMLERFSSESEAAVGQMFILRGQLCYVDRILKEDTSDSKRDNPRLRVIFENGTEADLLKRSLARALYKDPHSRRVNFDLNLFSDKSFTISHGDKPTGYIYILGSETTAPALASLKTTGKLVKIGYSSQDVHERIKNAQTDPTYLEAPVRLLAQIECFNLNPQKFENLIHAFLYQQRLKMTLISASGKPYHPEEWFAVSVETAVEVCNRIIDGTIVQYRMDNTAGVIVKKHAALK